MEYDKARTDCFSSLGYNELRFKNEAVINNIDKVIKAIKEFINIKKIDNI